MKLLVLGNAEIKPRASEFGSRCSSTEQHLDPKPGSGWRMCKFLLLCSATSCVPRDLNFPLSKFLHQASAGLSEAEMKSWVGGCGPALAAEMLEMAVTPVSQNLSEAWRNQII